MAATGYTPISLYYSTTAAAVPVNTNLVNGELAINITDRKLYAKDNTGTVFLLASASDIGGVSTFSAGTTGFTPSTATNGAITLAGTLNVANGGTGLTSLTAGSLPYGNGTSAYNALSIGTSGQILTSSGTAPQWTTLSGVAVTAISFGTTGLTPATSTSGSITVAGTLNVANGGTGLTSLTAGYIPYGNGTGAFSSSTNLSFNGSSLSISNGGGVGGVAVTSTVTTAATWSSWTNTTNSLYVGIDNSSGSAFGVPYCTAIWSGSATYPTVFFTNNTERMRILATGNVLVGATTGTALLTVGSSTTTPSLKVPNIVEAANIVASAPASTQTFYLNNGAVQYYTTNAANNWTVNIAFSSGTTMNTAMAVGDSMSMTMLTTQGSTAYYNTAVQIDGTTSGVTTKWQGSAPTSGNASAIDSYTYVVIKTAASTYTVLASQTKFA